VFNFRVRRHLTPDAEPADDRGGRDIERAGRMVAAAADAWNNKLISKLPTAPEKEIRKRPDRLARISKSIKSFFDPFIAEQERRFQKARDEQRLRDLGLGS
jgi:hypothetical protein